MDGLEPQSQERLVRDREQMLKGPCVAQVQEPRAPNLLGTFPESVDPRRASACSGPASRVRGRLEACPEGRDGSGTVLSRLRLTAVCCVLV